MGFLFNSKVEKFLINGIILFFIFDFWFFKINNIGVSIINSFDIILI